MMGERRVDQSALFYEFSLERHVPADHMLRAIDRFVELDGLRAHLAPFYSAIGRPSIDPELLIRMLLVGYCFGIRSERRLCEEVHLNLAYRWFCRLGLDGDVPDHSTFSKNRHGRFRDSDLLRELFETVLRRCMAEGLVGGEGFAVDASLIKADANRQRCVPGDEGLPSEPHLLGHALPDASEPARLLPHRRDVVQGVLGGDLNWSLLGLGAVIGAVVIAIDEALRRSSKYSLPPLAVGMGMYLPMTLSLTIPIGAALGWLFDKWAARTSGDVEGKKRTGILLATGLIVGESIFGVIYAAMIAAAGSEEAIAIAPESWDSGAGIVGVVIFVAAIASLYQWTEREAKERVEA